MKHELRHIIAERRIKARNSDDSETVVTVRLGAPTSTTDDTSVVTPYQILYKGRTRTFRAVGIDGFQSIVLAMRMIEVELESLAGAESIQMSTDDNDDLGVRYC